MLYYVGRDCREVFRLITNLRIEFVSEILRRIFFIGSMRS
jgi:hypothetical protein